VSENKKITMDEAEALLNDDATHAADSVLKLTGAMSTRGSSMP
jgi:hypothetical protein